MTNLQQTSYLTARTESFSAKIRNKTRMPTVPTFIQHSSGGPSHGNQTTERIQRHPDW